MLWHLNLACTQSISSTFIAYYLVQFYIWNTAGKVFGQTTNSKHLLNPSCWTALSMSYHSNSTGNVSGIRNNAHVVDTDEFDLEMFMNAVAQYSSQ